MAARFGNLLPRALSLEGLGTRLPSWSPFWMTLQAPSSFRAEKRNKHARTFSGRQAQSLKKWREFNFFSKSRYAAKVLPVSSDNLSTEKASCNSILLEVWFFWHIIKEKHYFKSPNFPVASNKFARVSVFLSKTCLQKLRVHKVVCTGKELLFTKLKCRKGLIFCHCVIFSVISLILIIALARSL